MKWLPITVAAGLACAPQMDSSGDAGVDAGSQTASSALVTFRIVHSADSGVPDIYLQSPFDPWISVADADGGTVQLSRHCEHPECGGPNEVCGGGINRIIDLKPGEQFDQTWDGVAWTEEATDAGPITTCERAQSAELGSYQAHFCYGRGADLTARQVTDVSCEQKAFTLGTEPVIVELQVTLTP